MAKTAAKTPDVVKTSADKGGFTIKSLAAGTYSVSLKKTGYADQTVTISVNDGEMTLMDIDLVKA